MNAEIVGIDERDPRKEIVWLIVDINGRTQKIGATRPGEWTFGDGSGATYDELRLLAESWERAHEVELAPHFKRAEEEQRRRRS